VGGKKQRLRITKLEAEETEAESTEAGAEDGETKRKGRRKAMKLIR